jgi:YVTN family beta-propeller protein
MLRFVLAVTACLLTARPVCGVAADLANLVFVPSTGTAEVAVIDARTDEVVRRIAVSAPPRQLAISASLDLLLTTNPDEKAISLVDLEGDAPAERIAIDLTPEHMQLDPTGQVLAVGNYAGGSIVLLDLAARRVSARIDGFQGPHHLAFARNGRLLYVGNLTADIVSVVDVASARVVKQIEIAAPTEGGGAPELGGVRAITVSVDNRLGFVTFGNDEGLAVIDLVGQRLLKRLTLGDLSRRAYATADGRRVVVPNDGDDTVSIVDTVSLEEVARVPGARVMTGVTMGWFETTAFVLARSERQVMVVDLEKGERVGEIALPGRPEAGVTTADGSKLYVVLGDRNRVAVIDARTRRLTTVIDEVGQSPWGASIVGTTNYCH